MAQAISARLLSPFLCTVLCMAAAPSNEPTGDFALILTSPSISERPGRPLADIRAEQQSIQKQLATRGIPFIGAASTLVNAVFVRLPMRRAGELQNLPGVRTAVYLPTLHRHLNRALDLVNASAAWSQISGGQANAGAGIKIAVIDSGIDQTHPALQDPSLQIPSGYPLGDASFTNSKVIVARSYVSQLPYRVSRRSFPSLTTPRPATISATAPPSL